MVGYHDSEDKKEHQSQYHSRDRCPIEEGGGDDEHWGASSQTPGDCSGAHMDRWMAIATILDWTRWEIHVLGGLERLERDCRIPNAGRKRQW